MSQSDAFGDEWFLEPVDRQHSDSLKWDRYAGRDVIPMWVADMDFRSPPAVLKALHERVSHGVFGYAKPWLSLERAVTDYLLNNYGWQVERDWLVWLPGLVTGLNVACRAMPQGQKRVLTATPVYPPFLSAPRLADRQLVRVPLVLSADSALDEAKAKGEKQWQWDWERLEQELALEPGLMLLCHPHNPVGRSWNKAELKKLASLCLKYGWDVCSDEIHAGLILDEHRRHIPFALMGEAIAQQTITLFSPSKTFNLPGLGCSFAVIPSQSVRQRFVETMSGIVPHVNVLGLVATEAAFTQGRAWQEGLLRILRKNRQAVIQSVSQMPGLEMIAPEATYLAWINASQFAFDDPVGYFESVGVGLSDGSEFGSPRWLRLNFGCSPTLLEKALHRMVTVCSLNK